MAIGTGIALLTSALIGAGTSAASGIMGSKAAKSAAKTQAQAAEEIRQQAIAAGEKATTEVKGATGEAQTTLEETRRQQLEALRPYVEAGTVSLGDLQKLLGEGGPLAGEENKFKFTSEDWQNDPQYAFIKQEAQRAMERSAAAKGGLLTGGFARASNRNITGLTSTYLDSAFNRALETYNTNRQNTLLRIQGLQGLTGMGYSATGQSSDVIGRTGEQIARNTMFAGEYAGNTGLRAAQIAADATGTKAASEAAGTIGAANAWSQGMGGIANAVQNAAWLYQLPQISIPQRTVNPVATGYPLPEYDTARIAYRYPTAGPITPPFVP